MTVLRAITNLSRLVGNPYPCFASTAVKKTQPKLPPLGFTLGPYAVFTKENYKLMDKGNFSETGKVLGEKWKSLSKSEKQKFVDISNKFREEKIREFESKPASEREDLIKQATEEKKDKAHKSKLIAKHKMWKETGRPSIPPNAHVLYIKDEFAKLKANGTKLQKSNLPEYLVKFNKQWKELSDKQQEKYKAEAEKLHETYKKELEQWSAKMKASEEPKEKKKMAEKKLVKKPVRKVSRKKTTATKSASKK